MKIDNATRDGVIIADLLIRFVAMVGMYPPEALAIAREMIREAHLAADAPDIWMLARAMDFIDQQGTA